MKTHTQYFFENLIGDWSFSREISLQGSITGQASFKQREAYTLDYREEGIWQFRTDKNFAVFKEYQYRYDPALDKISVYFQDTEKLFLQLILRLQVTQKDNIFVSLIIISLSTIFPTKTILA